MRTRTGLALLLSCALFLPLIIVPRSHAESNDAPKPIFAPKAFKAVAPVARVQDPSGPISPDVLRVLGITPPENSDPKAATKAAAEKLSGNALVDVTMAPESAPGSASHTFRAPVKKYQEASARQPGISPDATDSGLPETLSPQGAFSAALFTAVGGVNTQAAQLHLLADWDGREDMTADRSAEVLKIAPPSPTPSPTPPDFAFSRTAVSEHTRGNGHPFFDVYYAGDALGNLYIPVDLSSTPLADVIFQVNFSQLVNTNASNGFTLLNPTGGDCASAQMVVTGMAVNPVADLGDFDSSLCGTTGELTYISVLDIGSSCSSNSSGEPIRTRIFALGMSEGSDAGGGFITFTSFRQLARSSLSDVAGLAVDDDGSLYFPLVDLAAVNPATGLGGSGAAIFKATEVPRTSCTTSGRINRAIIDIPGLSGSIPATLTQGTVNGTDARLTNYSGTSSVFGNIAALTAGDNNVIYAAMAASNTGVADVTQGLFAAPGTFPGGLPSMIMTFADTVGRLDTCTAADPSLSGILPTADGIADPAGPGTSITWRAFVLGNGPDIRTSTAPLSFVAGTAQNTLKLDMQIDATIYSGIAVNEEGTAFVISGGTPAGVGSNPSPSRSEILGFEDRQPYDRRADYVDFRANGVPVPPASGGNVGDGDSDRFDHIFYQAPNDTVTAQPVGLAGLSRGFLRYTNRLVGTNPAAGTLGSGITLGATSHVLGDDDTVGPILFENLDQSHQVAGGDDQTAPNSGDDNDGLGSPTIAGALNGGFEFSFGGPVGATNSVWNGFFLNSNGNISFGAGDTANIANILSFRSGPPRVAPAWSDLNPAARVITFGAFPVQAMGFANVNAFKVRWINVPEFGSEACTGQDGGASNNFSITLYDDGTGIDENASQPLNPSNAAGNNSAPFDLLEGPTDRRFVPPVMAGGAPVPEVPRPAGSGLMNFDYGRMDLLGTDANPVLSGFSIGGLDPLNPPGMCEVNLSELARAADTSPFGVLPGNQTASILPGVIGEGTEPTIYEFFNGGAHGSVSGGGLVTPSSADFDLRFEGNDPAASKPASQIDQDRGRINLFGAGSAPPASPSISSVLVVPGAFTPNAGTDLLDAIGSVDVFITGSGFFPNEVTQICPGGSGQPPPGIPTERPGKTVSSAVTFSLDNNLDSIPEAVVALTNITPINRNLISARLTPLATAPGTAFPFIAVMGQGAFTVTTTFTSGDNNIFGPFTRTASQGGIALGARAPIVLGVSKTNGDCSASQDVTISGFNFSAGGLVTAVFAVEDGNPANVINASSFTVLNNNEIQASFNFGGVNAGKRFLIFVTGPGGTSRNIFPSLPPGAPAGAPLGNEQGNVISFNCASAVALDTLQFSSANLNVTEDSTTVGVTVSRLNPGPGTVTVDYATADLSATQKGDYEFAAGTLTFAPGETTKVIPILINEDSFLEGTESFVLNLSNPTGGGTAGAPSTITILDDEVVVLSTNVIDNASDFVRQQYHDFLNRDADAPGLAFWTNEITSCGSNAACIDLKRQNVSAAFFLSIEFQETGGNVLRLQRLAFGRKSNEAATRVPYTQFMRDAQQVGRGVIVGQAGYQTVLEQNKQAYAEQVVSSAAFITRYPLALSAAAYVDALFAAAGVVPTTAERNAAIAAFGAGGLAGRVAALRSATDANSVKAAEFNADFVLMQYYGYLRRNPTDAPDSNDDGYQFWLTKLNSFGGNFVQADMVKSFLVSGEYRHRFGLN
ncbi:MAG TPA: Calx-beta domain-containing protein [Pyrinomonadaceae bacterium]|nr:Calx-beta domain-containing protein [Pyrinomonadaceae bacterium]